MLLRPHLLTLCLHLLNRGLKLLSLTLLMSEAENVLEGLMLLLTPDSDEGDQVQEQARKRQASQHSSSS